LEALYREYPDNPEQNHTITFTQNGNVITYIYYDSEYSIELNAEGLPVKYVIPEGDEYLIATYNWQDGNMIRYSARDWGHTVTYDGKKNPMLNCKTPKWYLFIWLADSFFFGNKNNIVIFEDEFVLEYTYNEAGFPVSAKSESISSPWTFKYAKK
jgi:hypothetical protein